MISNLLSILKYVLWLRMWSVLVSIPCELEKIRTAAVEVMTEVLYIQVLDGLAEFTASLLIFCQPDLVISGGRVLSSQP